MMLHQHQTTYSTEFLEGSLKNITIQALFYNWYVYGIHEANVLPNTEARRRMGQFAAVIFKCKRFLPANTTITAKPSDVGQQQAWIKAISSHSGNIHSALVAFLNARIRNSSGSGSSGRDITS